MIMYRANKNTVIVENLDGKNYSIPWEDNKSVSISGDVADFVRLNGQVIGDYKENPNGETVG